MDEAGVLVTGSDDGVKGAGEVTTAASVGTVSPSVPRAHQPSLRWPDSTFLCQSQPMPYTGQELGLSDWLWAVTKINAMVSVCPLNLIC